MAEPPQPRADAGKGETQELPPKRAAARTDMAALVKLSGRAAADLSARCFWHGARWREHDLVRRCARDIRRNFMRARLQGTASHLIALPGLHQYNDPLSAGSPICYPKDRYAALVDAGQVCDGFLDFLRI